MRFSTTLVALFFIGIPTNGFDQHCSPSKCSNKQLKCLANQQCRTFCHLSNACAKTKVICPKNSLCEISCGGEYRSGRSCTYATIFAGDSTNIDINIRGSYSGKYLTVYAPLNLLYNTPQSKIVCERKLDCDSMNIYAIQGFNDIILKCSTGLNCLDNTNKMYCGSNFQYVCSSFKLVNGVYKCSEDQHPCNKYKLTLNPTNKPTTMYPTVMPTKITLKPTKKPTNVPTINPTMYPTKLTNNPTNKPSNMPSIQPTNKPSVYPTYVPTNNPSNKPTHIPSITPTIKPTNQPTINPNILTNKPTFVELTKQPTTNPTTLEQITPIVSIGKENKTYFELHGLTITVTLIVCITLIILLFIGYKCFKLKVELAKINSQKAKTNYIKPTAPETPITPNIAIQLETNNADGYPNINSMNMNNDNNLLKNNMDIQSQITKDGFPNGETVNFQ